MPPRHYKKKQVSSDSDEDYEPNEEESKEDENDNNTLMQNIEMTSSGRLIRPSKIKKEPRSGSEEITVLVDDGLSNTTKQQSTLRRVKVYDTDKTYAPDFSKISRYLMAVKCTYTNAYNKLYNEEVKRFAANEPTLARIARFEDNANELTRWKRVEEISPSLARWLGTKSINFVVHGSVPVDILDRSEDGNIESDRRPLPLKKRGRPRKSIDVEASNGQKNTPPAKLMDKTPITVNEQLQSLVDESIARCSVTRETPRPRGRRTNNSMAIALSQQPSIPISSPPGSSTQTESLNQQSSSFSPFPQLKRIKMEIEDFALPSDFSAGLKNHRYSIPSSKLPSTSQQSSQIAEQQQKTNCDQLAPEKSNLNETPKTNEKIVKMAKEKAPPMKANAEIYLNIKVEEGAKMNQIGLFKAKTFKFDVDQSPAVQRYESIQVIDIFHTLPPLQNDQQTIDEDQPGTSNMSLEEIETPPQFSADFSMSTIDRLVLRQGKKPYQYAQALFCGGPLADISICPNALPNGNELFAITTFADEESMEWPKNDQNSYIQMWTVNPNELNEPAKLAFLLRVADAPQICSLIWCQSPNNPLTLRTSTHPSSSSTSMSTSFPLGLLAVGTNNGKILIYRIPRQFDELLYHQLDIPSPIPTSIILETEPHLTLRHPAIYCQSSDSLLDSIPLFCLQWSPFIGGRNIAAISATGSIYIWDILLDEPQLPRWSMDLEERQPPPTAISWMENDKICVASRHRQLRVYKLFLNNSAENQQNSTSFQLISECDTTRSIGSHCFTSPLIFPGIVSFDSTGFNFMGNIQQLPCYIWTINKKTGVTKSAFEDINSEQICGTNLSNCHQIRLLSTSICPQSGICASVGADGRLVCSLNGRMAPRDGLERDTEVFIYGRTLLQLIGHNKKRTVNENEDGADLENDANEDRKKFCYSHEDCCEEKILEIRLGDCALLEQKNERICSRRAPEICVDRRLESLTAVDISRNTPGLTFCGGDSGLVFIVPCTL